MHCSHCQSLMFEAEIIKSGHSEQIWYECPLCARVHLSSRYLAHCELSEVPGRFPVPWNLGSTSSEPYLPDQSPYKP
jgi:hypothetical protein